MSSLGRSALSTASKLSPFTPTQGTSSSKKWYEMFLPCCFEREEVSDILTKPFVIEHKESVFSIDSPVKIDSKTAINNKHFYTDHGGEFIFNNNNLFLFHVDLEVSSCSELPFANKGDSLIYYEIQGLPSQRLVHEVRQAQSVVIGIRQEERPPFHYKSFFTYEVLGQKGSITLDQRVQFSEIETDCVFVGKKGVRNLRNNFDTIYLDPCHNWENKEILDRLTGRILTQAFKKLAIYFQQSLPEDLEKVEIILPAILDVADVITLMQQVSLERISRRLSLSNVIPYIHGVYDNNRSLLYHRVSYKPSSDLPIIEYLLTEVLRPLNSNIQIKVEAFRKLVESCSASEILSVVAKMQKLKFSEELLWSSILIQRFGLQQTLDIFSLQQSTAVEPTENSFQKTPRKASYEFSQYSYTNLETSPVKDELRSSAKRSSYLIQYQEFRQGTSSQMTFMRKEDLMSKNASFV